MDIIISEEIGKIEQQHNMNLWTLNVIYLEKYRRELKLERNQDGRYELKVGLKL